MSNYVELKECLACGSNHLHKFCSLGEQPLANNLKNTELDPDELYPLEVNVCYNCFHSQLTVAVNRDLLYKHYLYVSGTSNTLVKEFDDVAALISKEHTNKDRRILDIACNDGSFLRSFKRLGWEAIGVDPAENIVSKVTDVNIICDYFPSNKVEGKFDAITCFNVVGHIPNPLQFVLHCKQLLKEEGTLYIQTSQANMIKNGEFDTIYHEHHSYFNINSMNALCERAGLYLDDVEMRPVHGTSYLFKIKHRSNRRVTEASYFMDLTTYDQFNNRVAANKVALTTLINNSKTPVVGYGAAAKGVVMSNYFGLKHKYIVDENPLKIGKVIGGVNIPIVSPDVLANEPQDLLIIVYAWNFFNEIQSKIQRLRPNNNDTIVPSMGYKP